MAAKCGSCQQVIWWARTEAGKLIPLDKPDPPGARAGNLAVRRDDAGELHSRLVGPAEQLAAGEETCASHFASCPHADAHRSPRKGRRGRQ